MKITLVAAIASNNVIGKENSLPWNIPEDLKRFKQMTSGHTISVSYTHLTLPTIDPV